MNKARTLFRLQEIDQEADALRIAITERKGRLGESAELKDARGQVAGARRRMDELGHTQRQREGDADALGAKLASSQQRLYGGDVRNPKELKTLEEEVGYLGRRSEQLQDDLLAVMVELDELREQTAVYEGALAQIEARWHAEQKHLREELRQLAAHYTELMRQRAEIEMQLAPADMQTYNDLRRRKGNAPVAHLRGGVCQACGVALPVALAHQVPGSDEFIFCPSCGRLLVSM